MIHNDRTILHCDMNSFYASVELLDYPEYRNVPMAVCGDPTNRHGIILAKNELAKKYNIKTAETLWSAQKKCPTLVCVKPHRAKYKKYSNLINEIYLRYTDMVEPFSIDESWLDVTASLKLFGSGKEIADHIRMTVKNELGLTLSAGVSFNKIFAKMGSDYKKPDATTVISRDNYKKILWPLDIESLFFVGNASAQKLKKAGIFTIGNLANSDKKFVTSLLGKQGSMIHDYANGLENEPVKLFSEKEKIKSVGNGITFKRNLKNENDIHTAIVGLSDKVASRLRKYQMKAYGIKIDIKDPTFKVISRQKQLVSPTNTSEDIACTAFELLKANWLLGDPIRLLTITAINLTDENEDEQLNMFAQNDVKTKERSQSMARAMDMIRNKYGDNAITFGRIINNDIGIDLDMHIEED